MSLILILAAIVLTMREAHGWFPPFLTHRLEWWWQEWLFNLAVFGPAFIVGRLSKRKSH